MPETTHRPADDRATNAARLAVTRRVLGAAFALVTAVVAAFALTLAGAQPAIQGIGHVPPVAAAGPEVKITDGAYQPASLTITQGDVVTWTNTGIAKHTVTADDGSFDSGALSTSDVFGNLFDKAGTFTYHDTLDPTMKGTVIVRAAKPTPIPNGTPRPSPPAGTLPPDFKTPQPQLTPAPSATASSAPSTSPTAVASASGHGSGGSGGPVLALAVVVVVGAAAVGLFAARRRRDSRPG